VCVCVCVLFWEHVWASVVGATKRTSEKQDHKWANG
jgi:hypothetical protein